MGAESVQASAVIKLCACVFVRLSGVPSLLKCVVELRLFSRMAVDRDSSFRRNLENKISVGIHQVELELDPVLGPAVAPV